MDNGINSALESGWRECARWLTKCKALRADHKANWPTATAFDLAFTMRDGVLLCNLLNTLDPGCLDMKLVNQKPQMAQFLCLRNIKIFLSACSSIFDLLDSDLFEPSMLFDLSDFHRVLCTISALSNSPRLLKRKDIPGFYVRRDRSQEDVYRDLQNASISEDPADEEDIYGLYCSQPLYEDIYQDLCSLQVTSSSESTQDKTIAGGEKRDYVVQELVETERNYIEVMLSSLLKNFARPLKSTLKPEDAERIFFGIKELYEIHAGFHSQLQKARNGADLAHAFLNWKEKFLIYGEYCANLTQAQNCLQDICAKNELVNQEVIRCEQEDNGARFKLRDMLAVPMQRVLKYHLLLEKLVKESSFDNPDDREQLEKAREAMLDVGQYINDINRDTDTLAIINHIHPQDFPQDLQLTNFGRLLKDGELKVKAHDDKVKVIRYVFVFDQAVLVCKAERGDQYSYRDIWYLEDYMFQDNSRVRTMVRDPRSSHHWLLVHKETGKTYTMYVRTEEQKQVWIKALHDAMDNVNPADCQNVNHKFKLTTFVGVHTCQICENFLKGRISQGYRCEYCLMSAHKQCIAYSKCCKFAPYSQPWEQSLLDELWFVGKMSRDDAAKYLITCIDGTYLLRLRPDAKPYEMDETCYALSIKVNGVVEHIKVLRSKVDGASVFSLSKLRYFNSIIELVEYYKQESLGENFKDFNERLLFPFVRTKALVDVTASEPSEPAPLGEYNSRFYCKM